MPGRLFRSPLLLPVLVALFVAQPILAMDAVPVGESTPVSGDGIVPILWTDNPNCQQLGYGFGFKIEGQGAGDYTGTFSFTSADGSLTGGAPEDPANSVTISSPDGVLLDWSSTIPLDAVFMKGGNNGNLYAYDPEDTEDTGLGTPDSGPALSHVEFCYDYNLEAAKTAAGTFDRVIDWTITKSVAPESHSGFLGDSFSSDYDVVVNKLVNDSNFAVSGTITVDNQAPFAVDFNVVDVIDGNSEDLTGISATVNCPTNTVPASGQVVCTYSAGEGDGIDGSQTLNTATVESLTAGVEGDTATADIVFTPNVSGLDEVTVSDTNVPGGLGTASGNRTFEYSLDFSCPTDTSLYVNGVYSFNNPNEAEIVELQLTDDANVTVTCYAPVVSKNADTSYTRTFTWTIVKSVAPTSHTGFAGDSFDSDYTVVVDQTVEESDFAVSGTITVQNPNPGAVMNVSLTDSVGGTPATLACGGALVVPAGDSATCDYSASLATKTDGTNTATVSFAGQSFPATADYAFGDPTTVVGDETINVDDTVQGPLGSASDDKTFPYSNTFDCPVDEGLYTDGVYTESFPNVATIEETGQSDDANVDLTCYIPAEAKVIKTTTEGPEDFGQFPFTFELYEPAAVDPVESQGLSGAGDVTFTTLLLEEGQWSVVEVLPEGWFTDDDLTCPIDVAYPAAAGQTFVCSFDNTEAGRVTVLKLTEGVVDPSRSWTFALFEGSFDGDLLASDNTSGDLDGILDFGDVNLDPGATYTLCEMGVPSGWSTEWMVDTDGDLLADTIVIPYNPNADDDPPEDLGNRCFDFGAGTAYPLPVGDILAFEVNNTFPGGDPRTPGYWKNWNTCSGGGQAENAARNGGAAEGFFLLDDILNAPGILWDDINDDDFLFQITTCEQAVLILDQRDADDARNKKRASDAAYTLAMHLLAAQLNFAAGAETCFDATDTAMQAEQLLDDIDFDGGGQYLRPKDALYGYALELAGLLDTYNNGGLCSP